MSDRAASMKETADLPGEERGPCRLSPSDKAHPSDAYQLGWRHGQESMPGAEAVAKIAAVEKQIRLAAYSSAGDPSRIDDMKMFSIWAGELQAALKGTGHA